MVPCASCHGPGAGLQSPLCGWRGAGASDGIAAGAGNGADRPGAAGYCGDGKHADRASGPVDPGQYPQALQALGIAGLILPASWKPPCPWAARLPSLLASWAAIAALYAFVRRYRDAATATLTALVLATVIAGVLGMGVERFFLRRVHKFGHAQELLVTFGLAFIVAERRIAGFRQRHAARGAVEQHGLHLGLQTRDGLGHRGLGQGQFGRGPGERARVGDLGEDRPALQIRQFVHGGSRKESRVDDRHRSDSA